MNDFILELTRLYTDPSRKYHNLKHICSMLMGAPQPLTSEQTIAIWFHDAIYNPISPTNEEDSAELVTKLYDVDKLERYADIDVIKSIIMSTKKHQPLCDQAALVLDLDLAILGTPPHIYEEYVKSVSSEYLAHVPAELFHFGRSEFLIKFLERDTLFFTDWGKRTFEDRARANLKAELAQYNNRE